MRLTLRTLVAWLDDTLTPGEVRTIGQQVAESPFAQELVDRLNRVTRQRRLATPTSTGPDATDPNLVASYLDNELPAEQVAEYEKKCLTSDVHLAEVASVHQVLSLIGHKAKVPADAKARMYRLVRGRETIPDDQPAESRKPTATPAPIKVSPGDWPETMATRRPLIERFGPLAGVLLLISVLVWAAARSIQPEPTVVAVNAPKAEPPAPEPKKVAEPTPPPAIPKVEAPPIEAVRPAQAPEDGSVGRFDEIHGVVLRFVPETSSWERVAAKAPIKAKARLLNLAPFRNTLKLARGDVDLVDSTDVVVDEPDADQAGRLELLRGTIAVRGPATPAPFAVGFEGQVLAIRPPTGVDVGVERLPSLTPGRDEPAPAKLRVLVPSGEAVLRAGDAEERVGGPGGIALLASGRFDDRSRQPVPAWVSDPTPTPFAREIGDQFVAFFRPDRPILANLVEAMDDTQKDVKRMAVLALGAIGDMESVIAVLESKVDADTHRAAVEVLRSGLARGGEAAKAVQEGLVRQYDEPWAGITRSLLVRFSPDAAKDEATLSQLVGYLGTAPGRGTRELALDNLCELTHRDSLEYDPDQPDGKGLKAWQDFLKKEFTRDGRVPASPRSERKPDGPGRAVRTGAGT